MTTFSNKSQPNILHIFVDQQRFDTIRALGNHIIHTPNLDRLCSNGVAFTNAFSPSPVCVAARCSMIYGQYPANTDCYANTTMPTDGRTSFMTALTDVGYRTHGIGKCHFTPDTYALRGFQSRERQEEGGAESLDREPYLQELKDAGYDHLLEPLGVRGEMYYIPQPSPLPARLHPTQWIGDRSVVFLEAAAKKTEPWYLFSSFIDPHPPFAPPSPWHKLYRSPMMPRPKIAANHESLLTYVNHCQNRYKYRDQGIDQNLMRNIKAYYYATISFVDYQIGRLLDTLEKNGQMANTLILFTSDHGEHLGDNNCFGKRSMHDASARIPMIASLPGYFENGTTCTKPVSLVDLAPTFLNLAGAKITSHQLDGEDLTAIASGKTERQYIFAQHAYTQNIDFANQGGKTPQIYLDDPELEVAACSTYMALSEKWKYFYSAPDNCEFLFDKLLDPDETSNRAGISFYDDKLKELRSAMHQHLTVSGKTKGIESGNWREFPKKTINANPDAGLLIQDGYAPWADTTLPGSIQIPE
jgi:arylsulfatase